METNTGTVAQTAPNAPNSHDSFSIEGSYALTFIIAFLMGYFLAYSTASSIAQTFRVIYDRH